ncbi:hypothetical protein V1264_001612 [Littorina saxatilis]
MSNVASLIDGKIKSKKVMVFSKTYCPFCTKAKKVFDQLLKDGTLSTEDYEVMEIENDPNCEAMQSELEKLTGGRSVPRVFINQKFIGGGDEVVSAHKSGKLVKML